MTTLPVVALVVAKAPVAGLAKTRLAAAVGDAQAADIAAAALLDTLDAVSGAPFAARVVALEGDVGSAARSAAVAERLESFTVIPQRGSDFAQRLANAHNDAASATGLAQILQIGMDTPQVTAELLTDCAERLGSATAVIGPASDGGWWALGLTDAALAGCLTGVPMSRPDTAELTAAALRNAGALVTLAGELTDVDTVDDIAPVRADCPPSSRFALATEGI